MNAQQREAWERGVGECALLVMQNLSAENDRHRVLALALGLLHGTLGPEPEYFRRREERRAREAAP